MNASAHRLIFNVRGGCIMAVADNASSSGMSALGSAATQLKKLRQISHTAI